jgi:L-ascorbate metabolism protein UlaG (beta-lactamase superfamily)
MRKLALVPIDDEPFTEADRQAVAEAVEWLKHNEPIPIEEVLADFGLTLADWERTAIRNA